MNIFSRLWADDCGAVVSTDLVLVTGVTVFGVLPGLVATRNAVNDSFQKVGNNIQAVVPDAKQIQVEFTNYNRNVNVNNVNVTVVVPTQQQLLPPAP